MDFLELVNFPNKSLFLLLDSVMVHSMVVSLLLKFLLSGLGFFGGELGLLQLRAHTGYLLT
jgi:hypothetical protein